MIFILTIDGNEITLNGLIAKTDGSDVIQSEEKGSIDNSDKIGISLAETLLQRGGDKILEALIH